VELISCRKAPKVGDQESLVEALDKRWEEMDEELNIVVGRW
jgi:hypothetical protein